MQHEVTIAWRQHCDARSITAPGTLPERQHGPRVEWRKASGSRSTTSTPTRGTTVEENGGRDWDRTSGERTRGCEHRHAWCRQASHNRWRWNLPKVFLSWSGDASYTVALALHEWLPAILQNIKPFMSSEDLRKGGRWNKDLADELQQTNFGIICLTPDNVEAPWILFEAGALSKFVDESHVAPFLVNVRPSDLPKPLTQFNAATADKVDFRKLLKTIIKRGARRASLASSTYLPPPRSSSRDSLLGVPRISCLHRLAATAHSRCRRYGAKCAWRPCCLPASVCTAYDTHSRHIWRCKVRKPPKS